ncbi:MAG: hypothetical protein AAFQ68_14980 [Bacteroidota bacterium]
MKTQYSFLLLLFIIISPYANSQSLGVGLSYVHQGYVDTHGKPPQEYRIGNTANLGLLYQKTRRGIGIHRAELSWQLEPIEFYYVSMHRETWTFKGDYNINRLSFALYPFKIPVKRDKFELLLGLQLSQHLPARADMVASSWGVVGVKPDGWTPIYGNIERPCSDCRPYYMRSALVGGVGLVRWHISLPSDNLSLQLEYRCALDLRSYHIVYHRIWRMGNSLGASLHFSMKRGVQKADQ